MLRDSGVTMSVRSLSEFCLLSIIVAHPGIVAYLPNLKTSSMSFRDAWFVLFSHLIRGITLILPILEYWSRYWYSICISDRVNYFKLLHIFKIRHGLAPKYLVERFSTVNQTHQHNTHGRALSKYIIHSFMHKHYCPDNSILTKFGQKTETIGPTDGPTEERSLQSEVFSCKNTAVLMTQTHLRPKLTRKLKALRTYGCT